MPDSVLIDDVKTLNTIKQYLLEWHSPTPLPPFAIMLHPHEFMRIVGALFRQEHPVNIDWRKPELFGIRVFETRKMPEDSIIFLSKEDFQNLIRAEETLLENLKPLRGDLNYPHKKILQHYRWIQPEE